MNKQTFFSFLSETWTRLFNSKLSYIEPQPHQKQCMFECFVEIPIVGQKKFLLVLAMPTSLSYLVASIFFQMQLDELSADDATDALNELGNILAGQVQRQLNEDTMLDVPIQLTKEQAQDLMQGIEPDWEIFAQHEDATLYAGVFIADA